MFLRVRGLRWSSFAITVPAYAAGVLLASTVTVLGLHRIATAVLSELAPRENLKRVVAAAPERLRQSGAMARELTAGRRASMTPLHTAGFISLPKGAVPRSRLAEPALFGSSSRYTGRPSRRDRDEDDDDDEAKERPRDAGTYRTMCVRMCDGYYFPISFSATRDRFARDAKTCESSCGGQARLFVYRNPGANVEDMVDLRGQSYRQLSTAFLYRTEYVAACKCKPNPWDAEAQERHRMYALVAAKRNGSKQAAIELNVLTAKMKANHPARPQTATPEGPAPTAPIGKMPAVTAPHPNRTDDKTGQMALGARNRRERPSRPSGRDPEWMARALGRGF